MDILYIFNPENDLALASGLVNYTAPKNARKIRNDLQMLPLWIASDGDCLFADDNIINRDFLFELQQSFSNIPAVSLWNNTQKIQTVKPWGWSSAIWNELRRARIHILNSQLPDFEKIRELAHRKLVIHIHEWIQRNYPGYVLPTIPVLCTSFADVQREVDRMGIAILKAPWSSSGRGIVQADSDNISGLKLWCEGIIQKQGSVVCEKMLKKIQDFAMEFYSDGKSVKFKGYSVFYNNAQFSYDTSLVASEKILEQKIEAFVDSDELRTVRIMMEHCLTDFIAPVYVGDLGVDMMVYDDNGKKRIMPIIEVNMRTTMGMVASVLGNRILEEGKIGKMSVLFHRNADEAKEYIRTIKKSVIKNGRLVAGGICLVPPYPDTQYTAVVEVLE